MLLAIGIFVLSVLLSLALIYLFYFKAGFFNFSDSAHTKSSDLPITVAERRKLMAQDKNEETLEKIKEAVRQKIVKPKLFFTEKLFRRAGMYHLEDRKEIQTQAIGITILLALILAVYGMLVSFTSVLYLSAFGLLIGPFIPLIVLERRADKREAELSLAVAGILRPLKLTLDRGLDVATSIKELMRLAGADAFNNPVLGLFQEVLHEHEQGMEIGQALELIAEETANSPFTHLCQILSISGKHGSGWIKALQHLTERLKEESKVFALKKLDSNIVKLDEDKFTRY